MTTLIGYELEQILQDLEQTYQISITLIDRGGFFHHLEGKAIFSRLRHSHQKNACCKIQFDQRCVNHCRHQINKIGEQKKNAFEHHCWKGLSEIAVPLFLNGNHLGTCFVGQWHSPQPDLQPDNDPQFKNTYLRSYHALPPYNAEAVKALLPLAQFIGQSLVLHVQALKQQIETVPSRKNMIMQFIQQQPGTQLDLNHLAKYLSLSPSRCSHVVKTECQRSLSELIMDERIKRACQLLNSSNYSAQEIATIVGFSDQYYFNKAFKSHVGVPPGRYRNQMNQ